MPSGTLIVVGPIELAQSDWEYAAKRLEMACLHSQTTYARVAVLLATPAPDALCEDVMLLVRNQEPKGDDSHEALIGIVTEEGDLTRKTPFAAPRPRPVALTFIDFSKLPSLAVEPLSNALESVNSGLLLLGADEHEDEHPAIEYVSAALALTGHAGPVARVMPRNLS